MLKDMNKPVKPDEKPLSERLASLAVMPLRGLAFFFRNSLQIAGVALLLFAGLLLSANIGMELNQQREPGVAPVEPEIRQYYRSFERQTGPALDKAGHDLRDASLSDLERMNETVNYDALYREERAVPAIDRDRPPYPELTPGHSLYDGSFRRIVDLNQELIRRYARADKPDRAFEAFTRQQHLLGPMLRSDRGIESEVEEMKHRYELSVSAHELLETNLTNIQRLAVTDFLRVNARIQPDRSLARQHLQAEAYAMDDTYWSDAGTALLETWPIYNEAGTAHQIETVVERYDEAMDRPYEQWRRAMKTQPSYFSTSNLAVPGFRNGLLGIPLTRHYKAYAQGYYTNAKRVQSAARCSLATHTDEPVKSPVTGEALTENCQKHFKPEMSFLSD